MTTSCKTSSICDYCGEFKELFVTDYPFELECLCCDDGKHIEYVFHCQDCPPQQPTLEKAKANINEYIDEAEYDDVRCSTCNGSGEGMWDGSVCRSCKGSGVDMGHLSE